MSVSQIKDRDADLLLESLRKMNGRTGMKGMREEKEGQREREREDARSGRRKKKEEARFPLSLSLRGKRSVCVSVFSASSSPVALGFGSSLSKITGNCQPREEA